MSYLNNFITFCNAKIKLCYIKRKVDEIFEKMVNNSMKILGITERIKERKGMKNILIYTIRGLCEQ